MSRRGRPPRLGQHFLHDPEVVSRIVEALAPDGRVVLEIGPGRGVLTRPLARRAASLVVVELDRGLARRLREDPELAAVRVQAGDVLDRGLTDWLAAPLPDDGFLLAGNLPYQITSPVLFAALEAAPLLRRAVLMMQQEVAERLASPPGSRTYGVISVLAALRADIEMLFSVGPGAFVPPPRVTSAVVRLDMLERPRFGVDAEGPSGRWVDRVVHAAFSQRRKMLRNSLQAGLSHLGRERIEEAASAVGIDLTRRAETLAPDEFAMLAHALPPPDRYDGNR